MDGFSLEKMEKGEKLRVQRIKKKYKTRGKRRKEKKRRTIPKEWLIFSEEVAKSGGKTLVWLQNIGQRRWEENLVGCGSGGGPRKSRGK